MESNLTAERVVFYLCQQCEASLQFLQSLCQQKSFKERLLRNKVSKLNLMHIFWAVHHMWLYMKEFFQSLFGDENSMKAQLHPLSLSVAIQFIKIGDLGN
jgi:hypothetical protein